MKKLIVNKDLKESLDKLLSSKNEKTKEEELLKLYESLDLYCWYDKGIKYGIDIALNKTNCNVKGINQ